MHTSMWNIKQKSSKQTHRYGQQIGGYWRGRGVREDKMGKGDQVYGDKLKLDFWWVSTQYSIHILNSNIQLKFVKCY